MVEQRTENPCVAGSIPAPATTFLQKNQVVCKASRKTQNRRFWFGLLLAYLAGFGDAASTFTACQGFRRRAHGCWLDQSRRRAFDLQNATIIKTFMYPMNPFSQTGQLAGLIMQQRNMIVALSAIVAALPKESINREAVRKNISSCQLFGGLAEKSPEVAAQVEKLVDQILGQA